MDEPETSAPKAGGRMTLVPPEVGRGGSPQRAATAVDEPLARAAVPPAEEAVLRSRVARAHAAADEAEEIRASIELARWLVARDRDLEAAAQLGLRAVRVTEDPELRREQIGRAHV